MDDLVTGLVAAFLAVVVLGIALGLRRGALARMSRILRPAMLSLLLLPCLHMLVQVLPIPGSYLSNPVWTSTAVALNLPIHGSVTIDVGATLVSFVGYSAVIAMTIAAATVASERRLAEGTLYSLTTIAGITACLQIASQWGYLGAGGNHGFPGSTPIAVLGLVLACAAAIHGWDQWPRKRSRRELRRRPVVGLAIAATVLVLSTTTILFQSDIVIIFAAVFGVGAPLCIFLIRKWFFGAWEKAGVAAVAVMIFAGFLAFSPVYRTADQADPALSRRQMATERLLADAQVLGFGAGTENDLLPVYRDFDQDPSESETAAVKVIVEMGRVFLWMFLLALIGGSAILVRAALARGRDYIYAAAGAGVLGAIAVMTFANVDLLRLTSSLFAAAAIGLAVAQRNSPSEGGSSRNEQYGDPLAARWFRADPMGLNNSVARAALIVLGLSLAAEALWVLLPEQDRLLTIVPNFGQSGSPDQMTQHARLKHNASLAIVRGDLWAKSALAGSSLLQNATAAATATQDDVRDDLILSLRYAPYRSEIWLTLATLSERYKWRQRPEVITQIKMAYYTGPSEKKLIPARLKVALRLIGPGEDIELGDMIRRDIQLILGRWPALKPDIVDAYKQASPDGRTLAERLIAEVDPTFLASLRQ